MKLELNQFIKKTISEINDGLDKTGWELNDEMEFEIALASQETDNGKVDIKVFSIGKDENTQSNHKVKFKIFHTAKRNANYNAQINGFGVALKKMFTPLMEMDNEMGKNDKRRVVKRKR
jgi:hypothetical protein